MVLPNNQFKIVLILLLLIPGVVIPQVQKDSYKILGMSVTGNKSADANTIIANTGLKVGDEIEIPGDKTNNAIKRLWNLGIFEDVQLLLEKKIDNGIFLQIKVQEFPRLEKVDYRGNDELSNDDLDKKVSIVRGQTLKNSDINKIKADFLKLYEEEGYLNVKITAKRYIYQRTDSTSDELINIWVYDKDLSQQYETRIDKDKATSINSIDRIKERTVLLFDVEEGEEVNIRNIVFNGNLAFDDGDLRGEMKETSESKWWKFWSSPKLKADKFKEDLKLIEKFYKKNGYLDFTVIADTVIYNEDKTELDVVVSVYEGVQYKIRNISLVGNTVYPTESILERLAFKKGDIYNVEQFNQNLYYNEKQSDVSSLYQDNGYLGFTLEAKEVKVASDSVDINIKMSEGNRFKVGKVEITGNDKTKDKVIRRELYTIPGNFFSRSYILRSIQQLSNLQYFNVEELYKSGVDYRPANDSTVNLIYKVMEKSSDYLNASVGYSGAFGFSGSLGFTLTNFSIAEPFQMGGGQILNFSWQFGVGNFYRTFSLGFTEPWFMDTPTLVGFDMFDTRQRYVYDLRQSGISVRLGRKLTWPDDYFYIQGIFKFQYNDVIDGQGYYQQGLTRQYTTGVIISRNDVDNPIFPSRGSKFSLSGEITGGPFLPGNVDYYKVDLKNEWYKPLFGINRIVMYSSIEFGFINELVKGTPIQPFDFYYMGGNGLIIATTPLRGYDDRSLGQRTATDRVIGSRVMNKYTFELRAALALEPIPIYILAFAEAGNVFFNMKQTDLFNLKKSVGLGARIMINPIGLIGFDYGYGFDRKSVDGQDAQWMFHFQFGKGF
ncbi:MAG: outer membrane protein assembly factor BamA [Melioribacteraceae bacterium]|nr:outer membrane protein assembly factor BamA [Melioribacteraceae bacterium]